MDAYKLMWNGTPLMLVLLPVEKQFSCSLLPSTHFSLCSLWTAKEQFQAFFRGVVTMSGRTESPV